MQETATLDGEADPPDTGAAAREGGAEPEEPPSPAPSPCVAAPRALYEPDPIPRFLARHFPGTTPHQWNDWRWQVANRIADAGTAARLWRLSDDERAALARPRAALPLAVTPYYARLVDPQDPAQPLRRTVLPATAEDLRSPGEADDPLAEDACSPVPGLVHRYPNRVLFLTTGFCSTCCRYCTRSRQVGAACGAPGRSAGAIGPEGLRRRWQACLDYIARTPQVADVLLSGGDPLTLPDAALDWLLTRLRAIRHVEIVRIGTKVPAVLPMRVTRRLAQMLKSHHPLWMSLHFAHPAELTEETRLACARLADAGIPLGSQTVLLAGVNDAPQTLGSLFQGLLSLRVRPYYLYQCDPISGSAHFRTPVARGVEILRALRGRLSGYAMPTFVIDAPGGGGKIPLAPEYALGYSGHDLILHNYAGGLYRYPDREGAELAAADPKGGAA